MLYQLLFLLLCADKDNPNFSQSISQLVHTQTLIKLTPTRLQNKSKVKAVLKIKAGILNLHEE